MFKDNLLEHNQSYTLFISLLIVFSLHILSKLQNNVVSSAYIKMSKILLTVGRSLMYIKNNRGPRTEPWGTPVVIGSFFEQTPE